MVYSLQEIANRVLPVAKRYGLRSVYVFGSYARGQAREDSDIDLLVDTTGTNLNSLMSLGQLYYDLEEALEKKIDLITVSSLEQRPSFESDILFRENVNKEKVKLYDVA